MQGDDLSKIDLWIEQATKEIILSEPGTDRSQFPLRDLLSSLADKSKDLTDLEEFHKCATFSTIAIEEMLFSGEPYSEAQLELLNNLATQLGRLRENSSALFVEPSLVAAHCEIPKLAPEPPPLQAATIPQALAELDQFTSINLEGDGEILHEFANEAREHLENIEQGILVLEDNPQDATMLSSIFRAFHTFKGASGFLRLQPVNRLSHELENLLDLARSGRLELTPPIIDIILEGKDVLKTFTDELQLQLDLKKPVEPIHVPVNGLTERVKEVIANPNAPVAAKPTGNIDASTPDATTSKSVSQIMKVDTRKFDSLVELVGELVIAQSQVSQHPDLVGLRSQQLARNLLQLSQTALALQKIAMSLRMVAIKATFQKMNRLVRDLTANIGKDVELVIRGEDTEMDRTMVEELADPLMHMIRNSVDHGIEAPAARLAAGKSARGTIRLSAFHQGGSMVIEIADDGAGLNKSRILAKAVERGIDVIYVSNHGGRQLDHGKGTMQVLPEVVAAVRGRAEVVVDGGFMRGGDIVKAMALGANAVGLGKLQAFAAVSLGVPGVVRMLEILEDEAIRCLGLLGVKSFDQLTPRHLEAITPIPGRHGIASAYPLLGEGY